MTDEPNPTTEPGSIDGAEDGPNPNAEAAKWRRQLRAKEAEADQLRQRLDATHRALVEQQASDLFADPSDLWHSASIDDLRGDDGLIDPERAQETMQAVLEAKPHWRKPVPEPQPENGFPAVHQGARASAPEPPSFGEALRRSQRGP